MTGWIGTAWGPAAAARGKRIPSISRRGSSGSAPGSFSRTEMEKPIFNGRLVKGTGSGETVEVVFAAGDQEQLRTRLDQAVKVFQARLQLNNHEVLDVAAVVNLKGQQLRESIKRELLAAGWTPPEGEADGNAAAGSAHLRADSCSGAPPARQSCAGGGCR